MQLDQKLWQIVVGNSSRVPLAVTPSNTTMKKQTDEIARLENYAIWFRRETLRRWAEYLDKQIKKSGIVSNQSQIELETAKYGKRFTVSRQRISQIQAAKNPDAVMKDLSLMNVETVIGIAAALELPFEQAMEAAGYRTDFGISNAQGAASEMAALFNQMSKVQQELTLAIAHSILTVLKKDDSVQEVTDEHRKVLDWYGQLDPVTKTVLMPYLRPAGGPKSPEVNPKRPEAATPAMSAQVKPVLPRTGPPEVPVKVYSTSDLEELLRTLPPETRKELRRMIATEGAEANDVGTKTS
jgi:hypothetical protein